MKPLCIDLYCGLGGWSEGFLAEGYYCVGFDIEQHDYGTGGYPGDLVLQDILTLHGSQFKDAAIIVASPPCQFFSYCAMPWSRAKLLAKVTRLCSLRMEREKALFDACFRIQREACEAAGRHIPMIVENVRGAQPWVGRSAWNYGSFHLWGDVPALMPFSKRTQKHDPRGYESNGGSWFGLSMSDVRRGNTPTYAADRKERKERWNGNQSLTSSGSVARKAASAQIAKIPLPLSRHIARVYNPCDILRS